MADGLLERLPGGHIIAKDLSLDRPLISGNPFCRYKTDDQSRKYCSKDLWESADEKFVIPEDGTVPREHVECGSCGQDSYVTDGEKCGRCGSDIFTCPADGCDEQVHGQPDKCPGCGVGYNWK